MIRRPPRSPLFPFTPLLRSLSVAEGVWPWRVAPPPSHKPPGVRGTQDTGQCARRCPYRTLTASGGVFQRLRVRYAHLLPVLQPRADRSQHGLGSSRLARHSYGNLGSFLFAGLLGCFSSPTSFH